jgi:hypothetical protein
MEILTSDVVSKVRSNRGDDAGSARGLYDCLLEGAGESDFDDLELGVGHSNTSDLRHESVIVRQTQRLRRRLQSWREYGSLLRQNDESCVPQRCERSKL